MIKKIWNVTRDILDKSIQIEKHTKLFNLGGYMIFLVPLIFGWTKITHSHTTDDIKYETVFTYGTSNTILVLLFSTLFIYAFNGYCTLESIKQNQA